MLKKIIDRLQINFKLIVEYELKISGSIFSIMSIIFIFFSWDDLQISSKIFRLGIMLLICLISIIMSVIYVLLLKKSRVIWKNGNSFIKVEYGDILKKSFRKSSKKNKNKKIYVIPVNTCFDTIVDDDISSINHPLVSPNSIHGRWIARICEQDLTICDLDSQISKSLSNQNISFNKLVSKLRGNTNEYPMGSIAIVEGNNKSIYFLLAISTFDKYNIANCKKEELIDSIVSLINFYDLHSQGYDLYIPLMGTNLSRANLSHEDSLEIITNVLKINKEKIHGKVHIIIYKEDKDKVSI